MDVQATEKRGGPIGGLSAWIWQRIVQGRKGSGWKARWGRAERGGPRLRLVERITLAPRQSLALVEAEGRRFLVASSADGGPAFYPLDHSRNLAATRETRRPARVSW